MKIGLVPISAKPYHAGHHALVTKATASNDKVLLFVSTSDRKRKGEFPIYGADMVEVWRRYLEPIMPANVEIIYGGAPVAKVYEALTDACDMGAKDTYTVYSDPGDTASNYPIKNRMKYFPEVCQAGLVKFAAEENPEMFTRGVGTPDISGTKVREFLRAHDLDSFAAALPAGVDATGIFNILTNTVSEHLLRAFIGHTIKLG